MLNQTRFFTYEVEEQGIGEQEGGIEVRLERVVFKTKKVPRVKTL